MKPDAVDISARREMESKSYFFVLFGTGLRFGGPPISTMRARPVRPGAAR
jgi:hypothetical protein